MALQAENHHSHIAPKGSIRVDGRVEAGELPIRDWHGGKDLRGQSRCAGYVRETSDGAWEAVGFRYVYLPYTSVTSGRTFLRRSAMGIAELGTYPGCEGYEEATYMVERHDREA